jgi:polysaccharide chain length determinant protein (PEP-CTERM system associated)
MDELLRQVITILRGMWRRRWLGLAVAWLIGVIGAIVVLNIPNRYEASARIYVDTQSLLKPLISGLAIAPNVDQQISMLTRTLISRPNIEKLMRSSDMDLMASTQAEKDKLVDRLIRDIRLSGGRDNNLFSISYQDTSPDRARRVVQNFVSMFVESGLGDKRRDAEGARRFIDEQIKSYEARLAEAETRMKDFRLTNMALLGSGSSGNYVTQISSLTDELNRVQLEIRAAEQSRDALKEQLSGELPSVPSALGAGAAPSVTPELDARIDAQRRQVDELLRRYTEQHPDIVSTRRLIAQLEAERKQAIEAHQKEVKETDGSGAPTNPVFQQIKIAISEAEANVASLRARGAEIKSRIDRLSDMAKRRPEIEIEMQQMDRDYNILKRNYESLVARREQASMGQDVETSGIGAEFRLIDPPRAGSKPVFPDRLAMVLLVLGLAVGGGLFASFAYAQVFPTVSDTASLRQIANRPVLGSISLLMNPAMQRRRRINHAAFGSAFAGLMVFYGAWTAWVAWTLNR